MRFSTKDLVTLAVFGALWGSVEMSLGAWLHAANVPLRCGAMVGAIAKPSKRRTPPLPTAIRASGWSRFRRQPSEAFVLPF